MRKSIVSFLLVAYLAVLFYLTLYYHTTVLLPPEGRRLALFETLVIYLQKGGWEMLVNIVGNLAAFVPLGFLWPLLRDGRTNAWRVALVAAALSTLIETLQYFSGYRVADIDDILLNTVGGLLGYSVYCAIRSLIPLIGFPLRERSIMEA